eukprot:TRINITY_DN10261_c1_g2_i1.p2 TRINITY_DN10261_c1_g2~~TRINITY_DN10261_c1_g2_i1.p2  ORF type:complete len:239 (+),score=-14.73 TRINITY_DN10261_c1_g2_i1:115-831(+)
MKIKISFEININIILRQYYDYYIQINKKRIIIIYNAELIIYLNAEFQIQKIHLPNYQKNKSYKHNHKKYRKNPKNFTDALFDQKFKKANIQINHNSYSLSMQIPLQKKQLANSLRNFPTHNIQTPISPRTITCMNIKEVHAYIYIPLSMLMYIHILHSQKHFRIKTHVCQIQPGNVQTSSVSRTLNLSRKHTLHNKYILRLFTYLNRIVNSQQVTMYKVLNNPEQYATTTFAKKYGNN